MNSIFRSFCSIIRRKPSAYAEICGSEAYPEIRGDVYFYQTSEGVVTVAEIYGLPISENICEDHVFGFHIHDGDDCSGDMSDYFANAGMHYNPEECSHPHHAGDLPPLFGAAGYAFSAFLTDRFGVDEIIGRTVIIHSKPDDFTTQPSGNSGEKIACGEIKR